MIRIPKGNKFDLQFAFKVKRADRTIEPVNVEDLQDIKVVVKGDYVCKFEIEHYLFNNKVGIVLPSTLKVDKYAVTITAVLNDREVASNICDAFEIVKCNDQANYTDDEFVGSPILVETLAFVGYASGGGGGTSDHSQLLNRNVPNQHTIAAITGLTEELEGIETELTTIEGNVSTLQTETASLRQDLNVETQNRQAGDTANTELINTIATTLNQKINDEIADRQAADTEIEDKLTTVIWSEYL